MIRELSSDEWTKLQRILNEFEDAWQRGERPNIESFFLARSPRPLPLLVELVHMDLEYRLKAGESVRVEGYLQRFPELSGKRSLIVDLVAFEYKLRLRNEPNLTTNEYLHRFACLRDELAARLHSCMANAETVSESGSHEISRTPQPVSLPGYQILAELGRGGMGVVYMARQEKLERLVALKMVLAGSYSSPESLSRFRTEALAVARLKHANIVQIYEVGDYHGLPYLSLELCEGGSLAASIREAPLQPRRAADIVHVLAMAIQSAHEQRIVHRDLKPANVLLTAADVPKISDFGLAKKLDEVAGHTQSGALMGTPNYMAPEQAAGNSKHIGPAADIYGLGAILYELLTSRPPFKGPTALDTIMQVLSTEPVPVRQLQPHVPRDLETVCLKCLQKDPSRRYSSAAALAQDLRHYLDDEPILARPVGQVERAYHWARRNPGLAFSTGLAVAALMAAAVIASVFALNEAQNNLRLLSEQEKTLAQEVKTRDALNDSERRRILLEREQARTKAALIDAERQTREAKIQTANLFLERGLALCEQQEVGRGLLWLARGLETAPNDAADLQLAFRSNLAGWHQRATPLNLPPLKPQHGATITALAVSPDSKTIVTVSGTGQFNVWEAATGRLLSNATLPPPQSITSMAISPDSKQVLVCHMKYSSPMAGTAQRKWLEAQLWDVVSASPIGSPFLLSDVKIDPIGGAAVFSANGKYIAMVGCFGFGPNSKGETRVWEVATGRLIGTPIQHARTLWTLALSPDGDKVVTGPPLPPMPSQDATPPDQLQVWDVAAGEPIGASMRQGDGKTNAVFSPDGQTVVTGNQGVGGRTNYDVRFWDAVTGKLIGAPVLHDAPVGMIAFSPNGKIVVTCSGKAVRLWDATTHQALGQVLQDGHITATTFAPDAKTMLTAIAGPYFRGGEVRFFQLGEVSSAHTVVNFGNAIQSAALSANGRAIAMANWQRQEIQLWDAITGEPIGHPFKPGGQYFKVVAVSPASNGQTIQALAYPGEFVSPMVCSWDAAAGKPLQPSVTLAHPGTIYLAAFSSDGKTIVTGSVLPHDGQTIHRWEAATGKLLKPPIEYDGGVLAVACSRDGNDILRGGWGNDVLYGGNGNDNLDGNAGRDYLSGENGVDSLNGGADDDSIYGGAGDDRIDGGSGNDRLYGEDGYDTIFGRDGADLIWGGNHGDTIYGGNGNDTIWGGEGDDTLMGEGGMDWIYGENGRDRLYGSSSGGSDGVRDYLFGGNSDDTLIDYEGYDSFDGGLGWDYHVFGSKKPWYA